MKFASFSIYRPFVSVRVALRFDVGALLMRLYVYVACIGAITMFTLLGYSAFRAGTVASAIALSQFVCSPQISKLIDRKGQFGVTLAAGAVAMVGTAIMLLNEALGGPFALNYAAGVMIGVGASPQAMARTRWMYLIETQKYPQLAGLTQRTVFSYEGVIDDIAFMVGPAAAVALSTGLFAQASFAVGIVVYAAGMALFLSARETEPQPGWVPAGEQGAAASDAELNAEPGVSCAEPAEPAGFARLRESKASLLRLCAPIRVFFVLSLFEGLFFGVLDEATVVFTQSVGHAETASIMLFVESFISAAVGFVFGMLNIKWPLAKQVLVFSLVIGVGYGLFALVCNIPLMCIVYVIAAPTYAPFIIVLNTAAERCVPSCRLTEALTWLVTGSTLGVAFGPSLGGAVVDALGPLAGYWCVGGICLLLMVVALLSYPLLRKRIPRQ